MKGIYLDNNASTPLIPEVRNYLNSLMEKPIANPSSPHALGAKSRRLIEEARFTIADAIGTESQNILFMSSGSEANAMALASVKQAPHGRNNIVTTTIEHSSIRTNVKMLNAMGFSINEVKVTNEGVIDIEQLGEVVNPKTALVSVQWVNNETGVIQPIEEACEIAHRNSALFHCDATQAFGKLSINVKNLSFDYLSLTAHKIGGPQGCGALYTRNMKSLLPIIGGGEQEYGLRGGTENILGIAGFGQAVDFRMRYFNECISTMRKCRDRFETLVIESEPEVSLNGSEDSRVCNTTNLYFPKIDGRILFAKLDEASVYCSQSSACTSGYPEPSYVLRAMGLSIDEAYSSIRFSFGVQNTIEEAEKAAKVVVKNFQDAKDISRLIL